MTIESHMRPSRAYVNTTRPARDYTSLILDLRNSEVIEFTKFVRFFLTFLGPYPECRPLQQYVLTKPRSLSSVKTDILGESIYDEKPPNPKQIDTKGFLTDSGRIC